MSKNSVAGRGRGPANEVSSFSQTQIWSPYVCVTVKVPNVGHTHTHTHTHIYTHRIHTHIHTHTDDHTYVHINTCMLRTIHTHSIHTVHTCIYKTFINVHIPTLIRLWR